VKTKLLILIKLAALIVLYFICFTVVSGALLAPSFPETSSAPSEAAAALFVVSILNTAVLSFIILRSRWGGWKLVLAIFILLFGVTTFMSQIETAFFLTRLPPGMLPRLFFTGAIIAGIFSPLAVLILGKGKYQVAAGESRLDMSLAEWAVKLTLIVIAYVAIYFTFGYFIAWQNEAVRAYYGGTDPGNFFSQMMTVMRETPFLIPLQVVRAILWAGLAVVVIGMMKGQWWEAALATALLFSVVMNSQLLLPNPLMPQEVRMMHLLETATSNFLFGWLAVLILLSLRLPNSRKTRTT
jgi:hypothetical protein